MPGQVPPMNPDALLAQATRLHALGRLGASERIYRQILQVHPNHPGALHQLGTLAHGVGRHDAAVDLIRRAVAIDPKRPNYHFNLALALAALKRIDEAVESMRTACKLKPRDAGAWFNLGTLLLMDKAYEDARKAFKRALNAEPKHIDALVNLGLTARALGDPKEARDSLDQVLRLAPEHIPALINRALCAIDRRDFDSARKDLDQVLVLAPDNTDALLNLALCAKETGHYQEALTLNRRVIELHPGSAAAYNNLGNILAGIGDFRGALEAYESALEHQPDKHQTLSNCLFIKSYHVLLSPKETLAAHRAWDERFGGEARARRYEHERSDDVERRLRIGYVSPDLRRHSVAYFLEPILAAHDHDRFEIFCYAEVAAPDEVSARLKRLSDHWVTTSGISDEALADRIHEDRIDILVDLAGHTAGNRLRAFVYRPAPIQATYLGYFTTTGLAAMDYWLSDGVLTPEDTVELSTETIWRLPGCSLGYQPPKEAPAVSERPDTEPVVLGSFNDLSKVSVGAIALWSEILKRLPDARLLLKAKQLSDPDTCENVRKAFAEHGIPAERLALRGRTAGLEEHLAMYGEIDIALDTIPRTGGTTTMEALWMGVPVVTLAGERYIERLSASMLAAAELDALVCRNREAYIECVTTLAEDPERRRALRTTLREQVRHSVLCDARDLTGRIEAAYRSMWRIYLEGKPPISPGPA
ncbi:MAG: tetratricopeptide repeat protein [Gammaproteobacteria bacterium]|nr:tetratricopeptide repeat protein [Gammaproteobacteria bacterium]